MSSFVSSAGDLYLKCDGCTLTVLTDKGQTDRLLVNDYIRENGWKTMKKKNKWINLCPDCKKAFYEKRREEWLNQEKEG